MKVTLNWLKQYVDFNWSPEELTERLTMLGLEVEGVQKISGAFDGIVVAQVITRDKHPNADKLSLCRVNDGTGERQIVCGAQNFKAGDKVPLILPGASLPPKAGESGRGLIKAFRFGLMMPGGSRLVLDLAKPARIDKAFVVDATVDAPARLVLDLAPTDRESFLRKVALDGKTAGTEPPPRSAPQPKSSSRCRGSNPRPTR